MREQRNIGKRRSPLAIGSQEFRALGYQLIDRIAIFLDSLPERTVTPGEAPSAVRKALQAALSLPLKGTDPAQLLQHAADLLFEHSLFNGHPRFWGYITSSAAAIGALGDLLAAAVNANVGAWSLSPMAMEIEAQTIRWIAEMLSYPSDCAGVRLDRAGNRRRNLHSAGGEARAADYRVPACLGWPRRYKRLEPYRASKTSRNSRVTSRSAHRAPPRCPARSGPNNGYARQVRRNTQWRPAPP
jgi:hypothetical protein